MACGATLKRSYEFDPLHSPGRSPKRICGELLTPHKPQCPNYSHPASFVDAANKLAGHCASTSPSVSPARSSAMHMWPVSSRPLAPVSPSSSLTEVSPSRSDYDIAKSPSVSNVSKEQPLLTLRQVDIICKRIVAEQDERIRERFDEVLTNKLAEQYEQFLKFNHDQLRRKFDANTADCSYVS